MHREPENMRLHASKTVSFVGALLACNLAIADQSGAEQRTQLSTTFAMIASLKAAVSESFAETGRLPEKYSEIGMLGPKKIWHADSKLMADGLIVVTFNDNANEALKGRIIKVVPMVDVSGRLVFFCLAPGLPISLRPSDCQ
jgi:hypothetical protein